MNLHPLARAAALIGLSTLLAACGGGGLFGGGSNANAPEAVATASNVPVNSREAKDQENSIWDLFNNDANPNVTVEVNKYLWLAAQDVLNFLPIESVDPFTGVIVTGYGTPPGGGRSYRATIYVQDPALDARSLKVALQSRGGGPVSAETQRAVEDAILTRARQLRIQDGKL